MASFGVFVADVEVERILAVRLVVVGRSGLLCGRCAAVGATACAGYPGPGKDAFAAGSGVVVRSAG